MQIMKFTKFFWQIKLTSAIALAMICFASKLARVQPANLLPIVFNNREPLDNRGAPGDTQGGGTRDGQKCPNINTREHLTALVPFSPQKQGKPYVWGWTVTDSPSILLYVPDSPILMKAGVFTLWDETDPNDRNHKSIYEGTFTLIGTPGIISLNIPSTIKLEPNKRYHWYVKVPLSCERGDINDEVSGWIFRTELTEPKTFVSETVREKVRFYAANGIWFDAVRLLAQPRQNNADNNLDVAWAELLKGANWESFANKPIVPCCTLEASSEGTGNVR